MFLLSEEDQRKLLEIARGSVRAHLSGEVYYLPEIPGGALAEPHPIFISIHKHQELRGCVGNIHPSGSLYRSVAECAIAAAFGDPRFTPLMRNELDDVDFEISVLSS